MGDASLPLHSLEGHIARTVYGKKEGDPVFSRIDTVAAVLIWANVCWHEPGELILLLSSNK